MKRAKIKPKTVTLTPAEIKRLKWDIVDDVTSKAFLLFLAAARDELKLGDESLCKVAERLDRYAGYVDQHIVTLRQVQEIIESNTGLKFKGW